MPSADLNSSLSLIVQKTVIDRNYIPTLQVRRDFIDAFEGSLIEHRFLNGPFYEYKFVAIEINQLLRSISDQAHRHCVQQFVAKIDAGEWFRRLSPLDLVAKCLEGPALLLFQNWNWFEYP